MTADPDDPTYGYFLLYADPPPSSRNLPDARTDADAIQAAVEAAFDYATAVQLRHHTESGTYLIGSATADGVFTPAAMPDQHHGAQHQVSSNTTAGTGRGGAQFPALPAGTASTPYDPDDAARHLLVTWPPSGPQAMTHRLSASAAVYGPAKPLPFGPGSGRKLGSPRQRSS